MNIPFSYSHLHDKQNPTRDCIPEIEYTSYMGIIQQWALCYPYIHDYCQHALNQNRTFTYDEFHAMENWVRLQKKS